MTTFYEYISGISEQCIRNCFYDSLYAANTSLRTADGLLHCFLPENSNGH